VFRADVFRLWKGMLDALRADRNRAALRVTAAIRTAIAKKRVAWEKGREARLQVCGDGARFVACRGIVCGAR
jgi:hypothetical protein